MVKVAGDTSTGLAPLSINFGLLCFAVAGTVDVFLPLHSKNGGERPQINYQRTLSCGVIDLVPPTMCRPEVSP